jgi:putative hydrolase of the HAD superfamily
VRYSGVLFDLYGTLVPPFRMREHVEMIRQCAEQLGLPFEDCHRYWGQTFPQRMRGEFAGAADNFAWVLRQMDRRATRGALARAEAIYAQFAAEGLQPVAGAVEMLACLRSRGLRIGLVSNCAPDIPALWAQSVLAQYFDHCAFSCQVRAVKPEAAIYQAALDALGLAPGETLYVGDGSDEELSGAACCGMHPVLIAVDLSNTYDARHPDVEGWTGPVIRSLSELIGFLAA